jgi:hypothetical protein
MPFPMACSTQKADLIGLVHWKALLTQKAGLKAWAWPTQKACWTPRALKVYVDKEVLDLFTCSNSSTGSNNYQGQKTY